MHFSHEKTYQRKQSDSITYTPLEQVFKQLPKESILHIEVKD